jgi:hypothetical protein
MVIILWPFTMAGILTAAGVKLPMLLPAYFKPFGTPESVNSFEVYNPIFFSELDGDPAITISWMLDMQSQQIFDYRLILIGLLGLIPLSTS